MADTMGNLKSHGITKDTPKNVLFGAGTFYKNLKYETDAWKGVVLGATTGGGKVSIEQEYKDLEIDGATVTVKGMKVKIAEKGIIECTMAEFAPGRVVDALHLVPDTTAPVKGYTKYVTKKQISEADYLENIAFVGELLDGRKAIVIMGNAICTAAFEIEGKNAEMSSYAITFESAADFSQNDLNHLPIAFYFPEETAPAG